MRCDGLKGDLVVFSCGTREAAVLTQGLGWSSTYLEAVDRTAADATIDHLRRSLGSHQPDEGPSSSEGSLIDSIHCTGDTVVLQLEHKSVRTIVTILNPVVNGLLVWEWEFQTLTGYDRSEMRELFNVLHLCAVTPKRDLASVG